MYVLIIRITCIKDSDDEEPVEIIVYLPQQQAQTMSSCLLRHGFVCIDKMLGTLQLSNQ